MNKTAHRIYIGFFVVAVLATLVWLIYTGFAYYNTSLEERFFRPDHPKLKPSGTLGHGLGIFGSLSMILGVSIYMIRKRNRKLFRLGVLKHWLELHIFLCTLGPVLVLFHTAYKFGGIVALSFWSMVAVFLSGIIGRFIYIQIPRTIEGRELTLSEVKDMKTNLGETLRETLPIDEQSIQVVMESVQKKVALYHRNFLIRFYRKYHDDQKTLSRVRKALRNDLVPRHLQKKVLHLVRNDISLNRRIERLVFMQNLFKYWHVAHLPFALIMLIIMVVHVGVTLFFGYRWIF